jgi:hypothetical protein
LGFDAVDVGSPPVPTPLAERALDYSHLARRQAVSILCMPEIDDGPQNSQSRCSNR